MRVPEQYARDAPSFRAAIQGYTPAAVSVPPITLLEFSTPHLAQVLVPGQHGRGATVVDVSIRSQYSLPSLVQSLQVVWRCPPVSVSS